MENNLIEELASESFNSPYFKKLYKRLVHQNSNFFLIGKNDSFESKEIRGILSFESKEIRDILSFADIFSNSNDEKLRNLSYSIVSLLKNVQLSEDAATLLKVVQNAVLSKLGNFPSLLLIEKKDLPLEREIEKAVKKITQKIPFSKDKYFTDSQYKIYSNFSKSDNFSFSGPTSLGKSFLLKTRIKELVSGGSKNLVVLVPTRALITQFTLELKLDLKESGIDESTYKIFTNSKVLFKKSSNESHILILTPERLLSYLSNDEKYPIDYIFLDEAHKLASKNDSRSIPFYLAIENTMELYPDVNLYFSSPNVNNPEIFLSTFNRAEINTSKTKESPVTQNLFFIDLISNKTKIIDEYTDTIEIDNNVFIGNESGLQIVKKLALKNSSIIYCSSINKTITSALNFSKNCVKENVLTDSEQKKLSKLIRYVKDHIHPAYFLIDCLDKGVAFHFGNLPQLIREKIEGLFKEEVIKYLFCTSTLLEGVNMPAKNIFIFDNKKGKSKMDKLDFWNLAGRAGRLSKDFSGNIVCIKEDEKSWKDQEVLKKEDSDLNIVIMNKIDKNLIRIEKILNNEIISGSPTEKEILEYIANIICIDTLEIQSNYQSPVIKKLISKNKENIIDIAKKINAGLIVPKQNIRLDRLTNIIQQDSAYQYISTNKNDLSKIVLNSKINNDACNTHLNNFYEIYKWDKREYSNLKTKNSLIYYAFLMNSWINGNSLNQIIKTTLEFKKDNASKILLYEDGKRKIESFNIQDRYHVNAVINDLIRDIEQILRFRLQKYFNNYHIHLSSVVGEKNAGLNWGHLLEYGTRDTKVIALQNKGLSRQTSISLVKNFSSLIKEAEGDLEIDKETVLSKISKDLPEWDEIDRIL